MEGFQAGDRELDDHATPHATPTVASSAGAQSMNPPKLITCGIAWRAADAAADHQAPVRALTSGADERPMRAKAIANGSGPSQPSTAGTAWQLEAPEVVLVQLSPLRE